MKKKPRPLSAEEIQQRHDREYRRSMREYLEFLRGPVHRAQIEVAAKRRGQLRLLEKFNEREATKQ